MENEEMLEQTNEEVEEESTDEEVEEVEEEEEEEEELTDISEENAEAEEKKTLRELLKEHPEYQEELNETIIKPRLDRKDREFQKEMSKYKRTRDLLNASFDSDDLDYINESMESYLKENGIDVPNYKDNDLSEEEYEILGNAEANKIIDLGEDEIINELNRLKNYSYEDLSSKEKYTYKRLYEKLDENKKIAELKKEGIDLSILKDDNFNQFKKKFSKDTSLVDIVDLYHKKYDNSDSKPAKIGSLKSNTEKGAKEYYTDKEIDAMSLDDLDKPGVWEAIRKSMTKSKK